MRSLVRGLLWIAAIVGAICVLLHLFVLDAWVVPGDDPAFSVSVLPTLVPQDNILVQRKAIPTSGQLARCVSPENPSRYVVARVFGSAGEKVEIREERVWVSGKVATKRHMCPPLTVPHPITGTELSLSCTVEDNGPATYAALRDSEHPEPSHGITVVEEGRLFLVSDNRHLHHDSRDFGTVDASTCEHVVFRLWGESFLDGSRRFTMLW